MSKWFKSRLPERDGYYWLWFEGPTTQKLPHMVNVSRDFAGRVSLKSTDVFLGTYFESGWDDYAWWKLVRAKPPDPPEVKESK